MNRSVLRPTLATRPTRMATAIAGFCLALSILPQSLHAQQPATNASELEARLERLRSDHEQRLNHLEQLHRQREASYQQRIASLESEVVDLRSDLPAHTMADLDRELEERLATILAPQDAERVGIGLAGQTTVYDNLFNPGISLVADFVLTASGEQDSYDRLNRFGIRAVELGIRGRVDPNVAYVFILHAGEEELEMEEAYAIVDGGLPARMELRAGRMNTDFGRLSPVHEHDLPFVDKPGVLQEFLNGSLRGTGVELHQFFSAGDESLVRWSVGVFNDLGGEAHPILGPLAAGEEEEEGVGGIGERGLDDFSFQARLTGLFETSPNGTVQVGASAAWAPNGRTFIEDPTSPGDTLGVNLDALIVGFDASYEWVDPNTGETWRVAGEFLISDRDFLEETEGGLPQTFGETAFGFYTYGLYKPNHQWGFGTSFDWFERGSDSDTTWWDAGVWATYNINHFNRLRLEVRYVDDELTLSEDVTVMLQWTTLLGSHGHGIEW